MLSMHIKSLWIILFLVLGSGIVYAPPPPPPTSPNINSDDSGGSSFQINECDDRIKNNDETDIDCGGTCDKCLEDASCGMDEDCSSGYCNPEDVCAIPSCIDKIKNGNESGIDCGGSCEGCENKVLQGASKIPMEDDILNNKGVNQNIQDNQDQKILPMQSRPLEEFEEISFKLDNLESRINSIIDPKSTSSKGSNLMLGISLSLNFVNLVVLAILGVLFVRNSRKDLKLSAGTNSELNSSQMRQNPSSNQSNMEYSNSQDNSNLILKNYIQKSMGAGYSENSIRQALKLKNWRDNDISQAISEVRNGRRRAV
jgi:hypothetical protein